jgi:hypothetical protein
MILTGSAYTRNIIRMEASPVGEGEVCLEFMDGNQHLFSVTLEIDAAHFLAQACAASLAASDWPDLWLSAPNPNADRETLEGMKLDTLGLIRKVAETRAKLDAIEAAILAREDTKAIA